MSKSESDSTRAPSSPPAVINSDDIQAQAAEATNNSPTAAIPIPGHSDLEQEDEEDLAATLVNDESASASSSARPGVWRGLANMSLSAFSGEAVWRQAREDRSR